MNMRSNSAWLLALLLLAGPLFSQSKWPIASIKVEGLKNYSQGQALTATGLKVGQLAGKDDFEAARNSLLATGVFETVAYRFAPAPDSNRYVATFEVIEYEPIYPVRFERLPVPDAEIQAWLRRKDPFFGAKIPASEPILRRDAAAIEEYLSAKGNSQKVVGKVVPDSADQFSIVFRPAAGPPKVAEVRFEGASAIPAATLLNDFAVVAYGTVYSEDAFRQLLDTNIRRLYDARGLIRVAFPSMTVEKAKDVEGLVVSVKVIEGEAYRLGDLRITGASPVPAKELIKIGEFKPGDVVNFDAVATSVDLMKKRLRHEGYMRAELQVDRSIDDSKKTVDLEFRPELGPQYTFGALVLEGLDLNGEAAIKKLWGMKEGKPFNSDYPDFFLTQVKQQGLFDGLGATKAATKIDERSHTVDVTLNFGPSSTKFGERSPATSGRRVP